MYGYDILANWQITYVTVVHKIMMELKNFYLLVML